MRRLMSAALVMVSALPALAETAREREARCAAQSEIVAQAIEMRTKRKSEATAKEAILDGLDEKLAPSVPILVGYVYTLHRQDLKQDIPGAFKQQCADFKQ